MGLDLMDLLMEKVVIKIWFIFLQTPNSSKNFLITTGEWES